MKKSIYAAPTVEIVKFDTVDIIQASDVAPTVQTLTTEGVKIDTVLATDVYAQ